MEGNIPQQEAGILTKISLQKKSEENLFLINKVFHKKNLENEFSRFLQSLV